MNWLSIDPSKASTGVAIWQGTHLQRVLTLKPRGNKGAYYYGSRVVHSMFEAYEMLRFDSGADTAYLERGAGGMANAIRAQGWMCGFIKGMLGHTVDTQEIGVSEWRRVIKEDQGISWPAGRDRKKALAIDLAQQLYGLEGLNDDEADAVLIGRACIRMFNIKD